MGFRDVEGEPMGLSGMRERMMLLFSFNIEYQTDIYKEIGQVNRLTVNSPISLFLPLFEDVF